MVFLLFLALFCELSNGIKIGIDLTDSGAKGDKNGPTGDRGLNSTRDLVVDISSTSTDRGEFIEPELQKWKNFGKLFEILKHLRIIEILMSLKFCGKDRERSRFSRKYFFRESLGCRGNFIEPL